MLKVEGIAFRFLPDPVQIKNALEVSRWDAYTSLKVENTKEYMSKKELIEINDLNEYKIVKLYWRNRTEKIL